jgi:peptidoglycan/xylan/chitin deacetylase (PgdA/CDA1 family)
MILLYHSIIPDNNPAERLYGGQALKKSVFERHVRLLASQSRIVSLAQYMAEGQEAGFLKRRLVALTFDDGFKITFDCISSFLIENNIPATIFTSTSHLNHGELLWFSYLKALCFEKIYESIKIYQFEFPLQTLGQSGQAWNKLRGLAKASGDPVNFCKMLSSVYPLPANVVTFYEGMTNDQLVFASKSRLLELGAHTMNHPYLDLLTRDKQEKEIVDGKHVLEKITGKSVHYFAYPGGEYNLETVDLVKAASYDAAFAVIPRSLGKEDKFEIGRVGIYSPSLIKLQMKIMGIAYLARRIGLRVG